MSLFSFYIITATVKVQMIQHLSVCVFFVHAHGEFPLRVVLPVHLWIPLTHLSNYYLKQFAGVWTFVSGWGWCAHSFENRKTFLKSCIILTQHYTTQHTLLLDPGGVRVEPAEQLANIWTCLCLISQPSSQVETMTHDHDRDSGVVLTSW